MKDCIIVIIFAILFFSCSNQNVHRKEAERFFNEKKYEDALNEINKAIELQPDSLNHYTFRTEIYDLLGKYSEEITDLNKIICSTKEGSWLSLTSYHQRAYAKMRGGMNQDALLDINYFINKRDTIGKLAEAYLNKASILYNLNDIENSEKFYNLALKENKPNDKSVESLALVGLANISQSTEEEMKLLNKAITINQNCSLAYGARGLINISLKKYENAYSDFKKALTIEPNNAVVSFNMGQLFMNYRVNADSAIFYLKKSIHNAPQNSDNDKIYMDIGILENQLGRLNDAFEDFKKAEKLNKNNDLILFNFAYLLSDMNNNDEALDKINRAIKINSKDADYFNLKGAILLEKKSYKDAEIEFKNAINLDPNLGVAYYNLGYLFSQIKNHEQSLKYYDNAIILDYNLQETLVNRALEKIDINNLSSACLDLEKAYSLGRTDIKPLIEQYCNEIK